MEHWRFHFYWEPKDTIYKPLRGFPTYRHYVDEESGKATLALFNVEKHEDQPGGSALRETCAQQGPRGLLAVCRCGTDRAAHRETNTTLGALKLCGNRTMQEHPVGKLVRRAATYGWLPRLARDIDEEVGAQTYVEILYEFRMIVRRRHIGDVSKRADTVMNQFDSILRPGMETRFGRAAPAIALLREAVERGWKLKLARDVAAMAGTAVDSDSDDDLPNMS